MTKGYGKSSGFNDIGDVFVARPDLQQHEGETEEAYARRAFTQAVTDPNVKNLCLNPELGKPDPNFRTVTGNNVPAEGIDLDGQDSRANGKAAAGMRPHDDFRGMNGERGIDNQFFRLVGCSKAFQTTGPYSEFDVGMNTGSWGILIPIQLSPTRQALPKATYAMTQDLRYRATAHGRIVDGVLTTDPVDVRFPFDLNSMHLERPLREARLRATFTPDGGLEGILAGYTPIEELYDFQYGFRNGKDAKGNLAPLQLRTISSIGQAAVLGQTCNGADFAMQRLADGHRDPKTGMCTSISTQCSLKAIPAFVVDAATQSVNATLDGH